MAEKKEYKVQAQLRSGRGKNDARRTRRERGASVDRARGRRSHPRARASPTCRGAAASAPIAA